MRPKVICHIMGSADGRLLVERWSAPFGDTSLTDTLGVYSRIGKSLNTDAWTFGKNTITDIFPEKLTSVGSVLSNDCPKVYKGKHGTGRTFIAIDPEADIKYSSDTLHGDHILAVVGRNASAAYLAFLQEKGISYLVADDIANLSAVLEAIGREFGIRSISLQGGGILNGAMLAAGVIDELSLVIYPGLDGMGGIPSIFEYIGKVTDRPANGQSLELISVEKEAHGVVWIRYRLHKEQ